MRMWAVWFTIALVIGFTGPGTSQAQEAQNLLVNGGFEDGVLVPWNTYGSVTTEVVGTLVGAAGSQDPLEGNYCLHLVVPAAGANFWDAGLQHTDHVFESGKKYTLSAFLKCKQGTLQINFKPELAVDPWTGYGEQAFTMTDEWTEYSTTTPVFTQDVTPGSITFHIAYTPGDFWIDAVRFYEGDYVPPDFGKPEQAARPSPSNGAIHDNTWAKLTWKPGAFAVSHDVYFGESFDDVNDGVADTFQGNVADAAFLVGNEGNPYPDGLVPGQTYYWRIDEVNDVNAASPWTGNVWSFRVRPLTAWDPIPADGMKFVDPNQNLNWNAGLGNLFHTVFFGKSFDEVNDMTVGIMAGSPTYEPGTLDPNTTYYWRVDEFAFPANKTYRGDIWHFTTLGPGGGVKAEYYAGMGLAGDPILTQIEDSIDHNWGDAEVAGGLTDDLSARWTADLEAPLTGTYKLITTTDDGVRLWLDGALVINNWTDHGTVDDTADVELNAGEIYSLQMEWYENTGGAVAQLSWSSPQMPRQIIPRGALQPPLHAGVPSPGNGVTDVFQTVTLSWRAGEEATQHQVYFGDDADAVAGATTPDATQAAANTTYNAGELEWGKTYYWRVDEAQTGGGLLPGKVWSFTTADFLIVEDFESYTDNMDDGEAIFQTWLDGVENGTGSFVGYEVAAGGTFAETEIVHGGTQSMPLQYDNSISPYYSEAERTWNPAQDWTANGVNGLTLFVQGQLSNEAEPLYVALEDSAGQVAVVTHPDPDIAMKIGWTEWAIPLSAFSDAGVNLAKVKTMYIGLGNRGAPTAGGAGVIFVDDIRVTKSE